ncbi:MAG: vanadium-dependent haloperoxidase [Chitinophagales bacterium]|nr:vanadium-dependent haloperoxidase [Chitinophagales bacterium]MDW8428437.1 vanadium-dependent haloperoxidase [Chitinophagales bacterium]
MRSIAFIALIGAVLIVWASCRKEPKTLEFNSVSTPATELSNEIAIAWMDMLLDQVRFQRVGPPPAARAMAYLGAAMYQSIAAGIPGAYSLEGQLMDLANLPKADPKLEYDWITVLNNCAYLVCDEGLARYMGPNTVALNNLRDQINRERDSVLGKPEVYQRSLEFGNAMGRAFVDYMKTDMFDYTREHNEYESPPRTNNPEWYEVTDVDKTPYEPFWGKLRPMGLDTSELCMMKPSIPYSTDPNSEFYKFNLKLYGIDTSFSEYERITALYWADDPVETFTPPGHWMKIAKQQIRKNNYNLAQTCEVFAYLGMAMHNAGISVWKMKYEINLLRPKTYINEVLEKPDWEPYIETPPFPEYPSGHSGFSGAAATVLTHFFGDVEFTDSTNMMIGLKPRTFKSFKAAAEEAAWSRMYGGIHFEAAIVDGVRTGGCIAENLLQKVKMGGASGAPVAAK